MDFERLRGAKKFLLYVRYFEGLGGQKVFLRILEKIRRGRWG
jgi:hypothetical protein